MLNPAQSQFQLTYEISPIILMGGIATNANGMPIIQLTDAAAFNGDEETFADYSNYFARYKPMPNSTLIDNELGSYPFANSVVAANAIITRPLKVSLIMSCPANTGGGYPSKLQVMTNLVNQLNLHNQSGGTYTVYTPSYIYSNCLLLNLRDISRQDSNQVQNAWQWDFEQPLLTLQQAQYVYNSQMGKLAGNLQTDGATSGPANPLLSPVATPGSTQNAPPIGNVGSNTSQSIAVSA